MAQKKETPAGKAGVSDQLIETGSHRFNSSLPRRTQFSSGRAYYGPPPAILSAHFFRLDRMEVRS